ncbi:MAG: Trk system potassium transporter TrkA [Clostridiales bacterium]|nr:Trk system potassium transporter TrkA [Clostridiales bacterium]
MHILIIGQGKFGTTLTRQLIKEGHDIVVIDINNDNVTNIVDQYDVMGICGNGANCEILKEAGVAKAKLCMAMTSSDELNILCCMFAKKLGAENTVARVRNPDYAHQAGFLRDKIGISMIVNPEYETARYISRSLRFPFASNLDTFAKGKVEIASIKIQPGSVLDGLALCDLKKKCKAKVLICAVKRGENVTIPSGDFILLSGDTISVTGSNSELSAFIRQTGSAKKGKIQDVMIIGGGRIGYYLSILLTEVGRNVKLIENNREKAVWLSNSLTDVTVINADGTDKEVLDEQGIESQDALVALTGIDEENIIVSMYAGSKNLRKVITKIDRRSLLFMEKLGLDTVVSPQDVAADIVTRYVRAIQNSSGSARVQTLYRLLDGKIEASEFIVPEDTAYENVPFKSLSILPNTLVVCIIRNNKLIFPQGDDYMKARDSVIVVTAGRIIEDLSDIFA